MMSLPRRRTSRPRIKAPPPVMMMPRSRMSAASSGGVFSRAFLTASTICEIGFINGVTNDGVDLHGFGHAFHKVAAFGNS